MSQNLKSFLVALPIFFVVALGGSLGYMGYSYSKVKDTTMSVKGEGAEVRIGIEGDILGIYPAIEDEMNTSSANSTIFEGLASFDENLRIKPLLAEGWNNPDDTTWRIYLKKNVKFHDGTILKASDVKFTFDYIKEKEYAFADNLTAVDSINVIDDNTLEIKTKTPYPILMNKLVKVFILSEKNVTENGVEKPVGTGPYKFAEWIENDHFTVERSSEYYGVKPKYKKVSFIPGEDKVDLAKKLKEEKIDITSFLASKEAKDELKNAENISQNTLNDNGVTFIMPNYKEGELYGTNTKTNPFLDKKVRQAVSYALDLKNITDQSLNGLAVPANELATSSIFGYNSSIKGYEQDIKKAKELLKEAGFENGFETTILANPTRKGVADEMAKQLASIGVTLKYETAESSREMFGKVMEGNFALLLINWSNDSGDASDTIDGLLKTDGENNLAGFSDTRIDELAKNASSTMDSKKRKEYLGDALKIASDEAVFIPLFVEKFTFAYNSNVDFTPRADALIAAKDLAVKKTETVKKPSYIKYVLSQLGL